MRLKKGLVYWCKYNKWKKDPNPIILCLHDTGKLVHAFNLNYLSNKLNAQVVSFIVDVATKAISVDSMYNTYHRILKQRLPRVIAASYRTYKSSEIKNPVVISRGFEETKNFIGKLKNKFSPKEKELIKKKITSEIDITKAAPSEKEIRRLKNVQMISSDVILKTIDEYIQQYKDLIEWIENRAKKREEKKLQKRR